MPPLTAWPNKPPLGVPVDPQHPLAADLGAWWIAAEGSGVRVASAATALRSADGQDGVFDTAGPTWMPADGDSGGPWLAFNQSNSEHVVLGRVTPISPLRFTVACRVKMPNDGGSYGGCFLSLGSTDSDGGDSNGWSILFKTVATHRLTVEYRGGSGFGVDNVFDDYLWHTIVLTQDGATSALYCDHRLLGTVANTSPPFAFWDRNGLGWQRFDNGEHATVHISWAAVWLNPLSESMLQQLLDAPYSAFWRPRWFVAQGAAPPAGYTPRLSLMGVG
jgi:hypothetical protein